MMKTLLVLILVLCLSLFPVGCQKEPKTPPEPPVPAGPTIDTTPEPGFPEAVETLYPAVEGTRVPFKLISTAPFYTNSQSGSTLILLRSKEDVEAAFADSSISIDQNARQALYDELSQKNYDLYQVLIYTVKSMSGPCAGDKVIKELIQFQLHSNKLPGAVYVCNHETHRDYGDLGLNLYFTDTTILMVRKSDLDLSRYEGYKGHAMDKFVVYTNMDREPDRYT